MNRGINFKKKARIVVVDDNYDHLSGIKELIEVESDFEVVAIASSANVGISLIKKFRPELVLMDINMPVMNGYDATKKIRESGKDDAKTIPIYAMTANAFTTDVTAALDAGMNGHIAKPIETDVLYKTLKEAFAKQDALKQKEEA